MATDNGRSHKPPAGLPVMLMHPTLVARPFHRQGWIYDEKSMMGGGSWARPERSARLPQDRDSVLHRAHGGYGALDGEYE
jgi:hypothetical protein